MSLQAADALMGVFGAKRVKPKKCKHCKAEFVPARMGQVVCSPECAQAIAKKKREKVEKAHDRQRREVLKTRSDHMREAQAAVNAYVRARDAGKRCISCGCVEAKQWHAGHYLSRGAHPELALEPLNIWRQCSQCNNYLSGNQIEFRKGLIARRGSKLVEWLEGPHEAKHYTIDDLKAIKAKYKAMAKELAA